MNLKINFRFGIFATLAFAIVFNFQFVLEKSNWVTYLNVIPWLTYAAFIYLSVMQLRKEREGYLNLLDGLKIGMGTAVVTGFLFGISLVLYYKVINPKLIEEAISGIKGNLIKQHKSEEFIANELAKARFWLPFLEAFEWLKMVLYSGLLISLLSSLILRKENR